MEFFDSHAHYNDEKFNEDRESIIKNVYEEGVTKFICAGYSLESSIQALKIANEHEFIYTTLGVSPNDVKEKKKKERVKKVKTTKKNKSSAHDIKEKAAEKKPETAALSYDDLLNFDGNSTDSSEKEESKDENR